MNKILEIGHRFKNFMDGIRVLMLIDRGIQNSNKSSRRWINKIISTNSEEWLDGAVKLLSLQHHIGSPDIRLYSCVNDRKIDKAIKSFQHLQLDLCKDMELKFYSRINDSFSSCLMAPENKKSKYFMLDIDTKDTKEVDDFVYQHLIEVIHTYPSKSGWHYIVKPFNIKLAEGKKFTVIKDGLLLINWLE